MNTDEKFWENRFKGLNEQYIQLKEEYAKIKEEYIEQFHVIDKLETENKDLKQRLEESLQVIDKYQKQEIRRSSNGSLNEFAKTLCSKWPRVINSLSIFLPHNESYDRSELETIPTEYPIETLTTGKTPQANPDQSLVYENIELSMFESFFVLGVPKANIGKPGQPAEILYEFNGENTLSSNKKVLSEFCFPSEIQYRQVRQSSSEEEINNILFGQELEPRGSNFYIFTLKSQDTTEGLIEYPDLPNSDRELIYCVCIQVEDIAIGNNESEWINTKCLCLLTYIPCFEVHFKFLTGLLQLKKLWRMETLTGSETIRESLRKVHNEIPPKWEDLLSSYLSYQEIGPNIRLHIEDQLIPSIDHTFCEDLSMIDICWLLTSLIESLEAQDFLWLVSALVQEKSIVFVSYNLDLLTTCVLGMHALLRPFKWPYLFIPLIPDSLRELLEAPIPILAGLPGTAPDLRSNMNNLIWVFLDQPNIRGRVRYSNIINEEVQEIPNSLIKQEILAIYNQDNQKLNISTLIKSIWIKIIQKFKGTSYSEIDELNTCIKNIFPLNERPFIQNLIQTQLFINSIEEL